MIIKKYIANTVEEAQQLVRRELGEKAVVLTSRYVKQKGWRALFAANKVEITAAIEKEDIEASNKAKLTVDSPKEGGSDLMLNTNLEEIKQVLGKTTEQTPLTTTKMTSEIVNRKIPASSPSSTVYGDPRFQRNKQTKQASIEPPQEAAQTTTEKARAVADQERALRKLQALHRPLAQPQKKSASQGDKELENLLGAARQLVEKQSAASEQQTEQTELSPAALTLDNLRTVVREEMERVQQPEHSDDDDDEELVGAVRFLVAKGIDRAIAKKIEVSLAMRFENTDMRTSSSARTMRLNTLKQELASLLLTTGPFTLTLGKPSVVALVGPTGVGKTTTLMKIASHYSQVLHKKVAIISLDAEKMGAREQIKELTLKFGLPLSVVKNKEELQDAVTLYQLYHLILIDTSGCGQYNNKQLEILTKTLQHIPTVQVALTISATTKDIDVYGTVKKFSRMPIDSLIFTKLDETIAHGLLVNVCKKTKIPISYLTTGQRIPGDLEIAHADAIAKKILVQNNSQEFDTIRQLVNS